MAESLQFATTDVFTTSRYEGNPLAIVRLPASRSLTQEQKQSIANEFNLSETVILHESDQSYRTCEWRIDIFITTAEIPLAGHPVIGAVCYLGRQMKATGAGGIIKGTLLTKAGKLAFEYDTTSSDAQADIPFDVHVHTPYLTRREQIDGGLPRLAAGATIRDAPFVSIVKGMTFCLIELGSLDGLNAVQANMTPFDTSGLTKEYVRDGSVVGAMFYRLLTPLSHESSVKARTRMILGNLEDPATGSASSALAVYLACYHPHRTAPDDTSILTHKFEFVQGVEMGRRSVIGVEVVTEGGGNDRRVRKCTLSGTAVQVMEGTLTVPEAD